MRGRERKGRKREDKEMKMRGRERQVKPRGRTRREEYMRNKLEEDDKQGRR